MRGNSISKLREDIHTLTVNQATIRRRLNILCVVNCLAGVVAIAFYLV